MRLLGKVMVVTGGGSGIGRQLVIGLLARGSRVMAADIRDENLGETAELANAPDRLATTVVDVTDRKAVSELPDMATEAFGAVDGYISNAGIIQPFVPLKDLDYETIDRIINVNLYGAINMAKAFLPPLLERPVAHIANVSSMGGFFPFPGQTIYGAAKAGVKLLSEGLYAELLETEVGVSVAMPGAVATDIATNSEVDMLGAAEAAEGSSVRMTSAPDAAEAILSGIEDDKLHIYIGRDSRMMNLASRVSPRRATHLIQKQMKDLLPS